MTRLFTIDEVGNRPHHWRRDHRPVVDWLNERNIRKLECALSAARGSLERDARAEYGRPDTLRDAMDHALMAWCLANSELDESFFLTLSAFYINAPEELAERVEMASYVLWWLGERIGEHPDAIETVRGAAISLIESALHPSANRKRLPENLPHSYIASDISRQFKVGNWIHTGRYRPARIVAVGRHSSPDLHLSYDDEEDEKFVPCQSDWRLVSQPDTLKSLGQLFSAGDWVRHERLGDVRIVQVLNTSVLIDLSGRHVKLIPYFLHITLSRIDEPAPTDSRPVAARYPPGTWVLVGGSGEGIVLDAEEEARSGKLVEVLTVLHGDAVSRFRIVEPRSRRISKDWNYEFVVWHLQRPRFDFSPPWHRRARLFWLLRASNKYDPDAGVPCPCCGYPNTGQGDFAIYVYRCILCGWIDDDWSESEAGNVRPTVEACFPEGRKTNGGYSLTEARHNFVTRGHMFHPDDPAAELMDELAPERESLRRLFDGLLESSSDFDLWYDIYHSGMELGEQLEVLNGPHGLGFSESDQPADE